MVRDTPRGEFETARRPLLAALAAGGAAGLAGCTALSDGVPVGQAEAADRVLFDGLDHTALGDASLDVSEGDLVVSDVDEAGDDGARVDLGEPRSFSTEMVLDPENTPSGAQLETRFSGVLDGESGVDVGGVSMERVDGGFDGRPDYGPIGSDTYTAELYLDGDRQVAAEGLVDPIHFHFIDPCFFYCWWGWHWWHWYWHWYFCPIICVLPDGREVEADRVDFSPDRVAVEDGYATTADLTAAGKPRVRVDAESLGLFGNDHSAVGDVTLDARDRGSSLVVGDVDGSGGDGVSVDFGGVGNAGVAVDPIGLPNDGMRFEVSGTGTVDGISGQSIGWMACRNNSGTVQAVADYSDVGSTDVRIEVVNDGSLVGRDVVPGGDVVATVDGAGDGAPRIQVVEKDLTVPDVPPCYRVGLDRDATVTPVDGEELVGDTVRFLADNPDSTVDSIGSFDLTGTALDAITVVDETPTADP